MFGEPSTSSGNFQPLGRPGFALTLPWNRRTRFVHVWSKANRHREEMYRNVQNCIASNRNAAVVRLPLANFWIGSGVWQGGRFLMFFSSNLLSPTLMSRVRPFTRQADFCVCLNILSSCVFATIFTCWWLKSCMWGMMMYESTMTWTHQAVWSRQQRSIGFRRLKANLLVTTARPPRGPTTLACSAAQPWPAHGW